MDYIGVFRNLQKALAIYGSGREGDTPVKDKDELVKALRRAVGETRAFLRGHGLGAPELRKNLNAEGFKKLGLLEDGVEAILAGGDRSK